MIKNKQFINSAYQLIKDYIECSRYVCGILKDHFIIEENLLRSVKLKIIPKIGDVDGMHYEFHGVGCYFELNDTKIEVDFGPGDRCDGFDAFRLFFYLTNMNQTKRDLYTDIVSEDELKNQLLKLEEQGIIIKPTLPPSTHLYYLSESGASTTGR